MHGNNKVSETLPKIAHLIWKKGSNFSFYCTELVNDILIIFFCVLFLKTFLDVCGGDLAFFWLQGQQVLEQVKYMFKLHKYISIL